MYFNRVVTAGVLTLAIVSTFFPGISMAQEIPATPSVNDAEVSLNELSLLLLPLTKEELKEEADAWKLILQSKVLDISLAEIAAKKFEDGAEKDQKLKLLTAYSEERTGIIDRMNMVLDEFKAKGGEEEIQEYKDYICAVSGIKLEGSDISMVWAKVKGWAKSKDGGLRWAMNSGKFLLIIVIFWIIAVFASKMVYKVLDRHKNATNLMREFFAYSTKRVIIVVGLIVGISAMGVETTPLVAMIGAAGFIVAFALQDTLSNFASGIMILLYRPFDEGDFVEVAGVSGNVVSLNLVSVTINTPDNKINVVPNNSVWGNIITNVTGSTERRVDLTFGIGYEDDMHVAQNLMENVLEAHPLVLSHPESVVRVHELADSSVNFVCRPWVKTADYWTVYWDVTQGIKEAFDGAGITIPFPQQDAHFHGLPGVPEEGDTTEVSAANNPHTTPAGEDYPDAQDD